MEFFLGVRIFFEAGLATRQCLATVTIPITDYRFPKFKTANGKRIFFSRQPRQNKSMQGKQESRQHEMKIEKL